MSILTSRPALRWLAPAGAALAIVAGGVAIGAVTSAADPTLPTRSAAQLLVDLQTAQLDGLSGTVVVRANLGLPPLPGLGGRGGDGTVAGANLTKLLSGTHTLRVWYSGPDKMRLALLDTLGETDLIRNGRDLWTWSSQENTATHQTLPEDAASRPTLPSLAVPGIAPDQVARMALAAIEPSTQVTVDGSAQVAGRDAYELVLRPRDTASLIGSVRLAIDATEHLPLRVLVNARGADSPAIDVSFQQVSFARPDPDQFVFNPPPGAKVEEVDRERAADKTEPPAPTKPGQPGQPNKGEAGRDFASVGSGWTRVLVLRAPTGEGGVPAELEALLQNLPRLGNGRVVKGTLFSVLITDDGRILVGAVTPDRLVRAAADPAAKLAG